VRCEESEPAGTDLRPR